MKKGIGLALAVVLLLTTLGVLAGCNSNSAFSGHWVCAALDDGTGAIEISDYEETLGMTGEEIFALDLNSDGSATITEFENDITDTLGEAVTWEESDEGVTVSADGNAAYELSYDSETKRLSFEESGQTIYLEKQ